MRALSAPLRDLLVRLAGAGLFRAKWPSDIHEEWIRNVLEMRRDLTRERLERTCDLMVEHILDSIVTGYEDRIPSIVIPDPNDRHVVAAAIQAEAHAIVTFNLKDFPASALAPTAWKRNIPTSLSANLWMKISRLCSKSSADSEWT